MAKPSLALSLLALLALGTGCGGGGTTPAPTPSPSPSPTPSPGKKTTLVRPQAGVTIGTLTSRYGATLREQVPGSNIYVLEGDDDLKERLSGDAEVLSAEDDDSVLAPEPATGNPFHFPTDFRPEPVSTFDSDLRGLIDAPAGSFGRGRAGGSPVIVAVLDTGVLRSHPALQGRLLPGYNAFTGTNDDSELADGVHNRGVGHGTMVAGVIARLAPDAKILPIRVLNGDGVGSLLTITKGIQFALAQGARIINLSCGIGRSSGALEDVFEDLLEDDALLIASAGNENLSTGPFPAAAEHVIAVAAIESDRKKSTYSNYGSWVDVVAPGTGMESAWWQGGYARWSGTSFATPCVAAQAAYLLASYPNLKSEDIEECIEDSATSVEAMNPGFVGKLGRGLIQFRAALTLAKKK